MVSGTFQQLNENYSNEDLRGVGTGWNTDTSVDFSYVRRPTEGYGDFPPFDSDALTGEEAADKIPEEEPNDERIDFGSRFNAETGGVDGSNHHLDVMIFMDLEKITI